MVLRFKSRKERSEREGLELELDALVRFKSRKERSEPLATVALYLAGQMFQIPEGTV